MLRSFLLRRLRRHGCRSVSQLGRRAPSCAAAFSSSSPWVDDWATDMDHPDDNPVQAAAHKRRHLYLVLDDWNKGFSIYKLDLDDDYGSDQGADMASLPAPVHRQEKRHVTDRPWNFATLGSKIIAAGALHTKEDAVTFMYDTDTTGVSVIPCLPPALRGPWMLAVASGDGVNVFEANSENHWTWGSIPSMLPFRVEDIESSAVHPDRGGRTLFVSVGHWDPLCDDIYDQTNPEDFSRTSETFSYLGSGKWRRHGEWDLPFFGQGHYDDDLDAWVGLHKIHRRADWNYKSHMVHDTDGYLCSSDVTSPEGSPERPDWKLCTERLFDPNDGWHVGASLVYMGDNTYCLVEVEACERVHKRSCERVNKECVIRLVIFRLKYGKNGELTITSRRPDRTYLFSRFDNNPKVRAFWM
uniref:DUF1618 domain-containing protein n=1 Tax=Aegilops tauschii TaxID=37682 RepID=R7W552_AEGTA